MHHKSKTRGKTNDRTIDVFHEQEAIDANHFDLPLAEKAATEGNAYKRPHGKKEKKKVGISGVERNKRGEGAFYSRGSHALKTRGYSFHSTTGTCLTTFQDYFRARVEVVAATILMRE
jgi:hypothetical protein